MINILKIYFQKTIFWILWQNLSFKFATGLLNNDVKGAWIFHIHLITLPNLLFIGFDSTVNDINFAMCFTYFWSFFRFSFGRCCLGLQIWSLVSDLSSRTVQKQRIIRQLYMRHETQNSAKNVRASNSRCQIVLKLSRLSLRKRWLWYHFLQPFWEWNESNKKSNLFI